MIGVCLLAYGLLMEGRELFLMIFFGFTVYFYGTVAFTVAFASFMMAVETPIETASERVNWIWCCI